MGCIMALLVLAIVMAVGVALSRFGSNQDQHCWMLRSRYRGGRSHPVGGMEAISTSLRSGRQSPRSPPVTEILTVEQFSLEGRKVGQIASKGEKPITLCLDLELLVWNNQSRCGMTALGLPSP